MICCIYTEHGFLQTHRPNIFLLISSINSSQFIRINSWLKKSFIHSQLPSLTCMCMLVILTSSFLSSHIRFFNTVYWKDSKIDILFSTNLFVFRAGSLQHCSFATCELQYMVFKPKILHESRTALIAFHFYCQ